MKPPEKFYPKVWMLYSFLTVIHGGFEPPSPVLTLEDFENAHGKACDCGGGSVDDPKNYSQVVDCGDKTAYLHIAPERPGYQEAWGFKELKEEWICVNHPKLTPSRSRPGKCTCKEYLQSVHSTCYNSVQTYSRPNSETYFTATLTKTYSGSFGGDWDPTSQTGYLKSGQAPCSGTLGQRVCWQQPPPIHVSDGGGPQDQIGQLKVQEKIEETTETLFPQSACHPLALPQEEERGIESHTFDILEATFRLLNVTNPSLAQDCWLCLRLATPMPLAILAPNVTYFTYNDTYPSSSCAIILPVRVLPMFQNSFLCFFSPPANDSYDVDLGILSVTYCNVTQNVSEPLCAGYSSVFICGGNLAYTLLPSNWTGVCTLAVLLPDIDVVQGSEPIPIPRLDSIGGCPKRAIMLIPLLATLAISGAVATGSAGLGISITQYTKLSKQLIEDVQTLSGTIQDLQDQIDSLAEVVLQNWRGLDLLTTEHGGICLALQERCCFYANKSGIVRDKIKKLQEDLIKRRKELADNPLWSGLNGLLPYLLPFLGPVLLLLILVSLGPVLFNKVMAFLRQQIDAIKMQPLQVHYHRLDMAECGASSEYRDFR